MYLSKCSWCALVLLTVIQFECSKCDNKEVNSFNEEDIGSSILDTLPRYVLYDINKPEGFNLRRDVYIRMASFIHHMNKISNYHWILVLPPWHRLYHWRSSNLIQDHLPWSLFFNVDSIQKVTPVVELHEFFKINGLRSLDAQVTLQDFNLNSFEEYPDFSDKWEVSDCKGHVQTEFWNLSNLTFSKSLCISFQGISTLLSDIVKELQPRTIIFDHAEMALHNYYGGQEYWAVRKSMQFSDNLHEIAKTFINSFLKHNYMCAHVRRRDFLYGHPSDVPSIKETARQIIEKLSLLNKVETVFIASDAPKVEFEKLCDYLRPYNVFKFEANKDILNTYMDGGVAIIDQIICSKAKIQEEREILGFSSNTTFNSFCGDNDRMCTQPTKWRLVE
ncbi:Hypothetical protein CINCED_3A021637 [Cinara cedri]|uniref:GDP-fucose protein O-fucosyltransferase 2 n=1 Tax=Cinara cedri TaxID=506608 RepID=A0A5E4MCY7_9HEMI|nr:Hypothetical protein CINCED_3A021637 [Cinara cedri]